MKIIFGTMAVISIAVAGIWISLPSDSSSEPTSRGYAMSQIAEQFPDEISKVGELVLLNYQEYRKNATWWSRLHFSSLIGAAVMSGFAGVILKLNALNLSDEIKRDTAAILAATSALLITIAGHGEFENKWRLNRGAALEMENLAYELIKNPSKEDIIEEIQAINDSRLQGIAITREDTL